jgi:hypothetical protein
LADGNLSLNSRNRGKVALEISGRDSEILYKINQVISGNISSRKRITNFSKGKSVVFMAWKNCKKEFRDELMSYGFPSENKSEQSAPPNTDYDKKGFWRGVIDGNGSLGNTGQGFPFLSLVTKSENLSIAYLNFLKLGFSINKTTTRNVRDSIYNICIYKEDAQRVSKFLYENSDIFISRKYNKYLEIIKWIRPFNMRKK